MIELELQIKLEVQMDVGMDMDREMEKDMKKGKIQGTLALLSLLFEPSHPKLQAYEQIILQIILTSAFKWPTLFKATEFWGGLSHSIR